MFNRAIHFELSIQSKYIIYNIQRVTTNTREKYPPPFFVYMYFLFRFSFLFLNNIRKMSLQIRYLMESIVGLKLMYFSDTLRTLVIKKKLN